MLLKSILIIGSLILLTGISSCSSLPKADAYECVLIMVDPQGNIKPLEERYWFCKNQKSGNKKTIWLKDMDKCIRDQSKPCKWMGTDVLEADRYRKHVEENISCPSL